MLVQTKCKILLSPSAGHGSGHPPPNQVRNSHLKTQGRRPVLIFIFQYAKGRAIGQNGNDSSEQFDKKAFDNTVTHGSEDENTSIGESQLNKDGGSEI